MNCNYRLLCAILLVNCSFSVAQAQSYISLNSGASSQAFSTGEVSSSHLRWQGGFGYGQLVGDNGEISLGLAYSPVITASVNKQGVQAADVMALVELFYKRPLQENWQLAYGLKLSLIHSQAHVSSSKLQYHGEYGLLANMRYTLNKEFSVGFKTGLNLYQGMSVQVDQYVAYHF